VARDVIKAKMSWISRHTENIAERVARKFGAAMAEASSRVSGTGGAQLR